MTNFPVFPSPPLYSFLTALLISTKLAHSAYKKSKLTTSGCVAALICGIISFSYNPLQGGMLMLVFYVCGMKSSRFKREHKKTLVVEEDTPRSADNVLSTAGPALIVILFTAYTSSPFTLYYDAFSPSSLAIITTYAVSLADTLASELGVGLAAKYSSSKSNNATRSVLYPFQIVPPGMNGGISTYGTLASVGGGLIIGLTSAVINSFVNVYNEGAFAVGDFFVWIVCFSTIIGFLGSLLDSILGATLQVTYFNTKTRQIISKPDNDEKTSSDIVGIQGRDVLSNCNVNLASVGVMTAAVFFLV